MTYLNVYPQRDETVLVGRKGEGGHVATLSADDSTPPRWFASFEDSDFSGGELRELSDIIGRLDAGQPAGGAT